MQKLVTKLPDNPGVYIFRRPIIAHGTPEQIASSLLSHTGKYFEESTKKKIATC